MTMTDQEVNELKDRIENVVEFLNMNVVLDEDCFISGWAFADAMAVFGYTLVDAQ